LLFPSPFGLPHAHLFLVCPVRAGGRPKVGPGHPTTPYLQATERTNPGSYAVHHWVDALSAGREPEGPRSVADPPTKKAPRTPPASGPTGKFHWHLLARQPCNLPPTSIRPTTSLKCFDQFAHIGSRVCGHRRQGKEVLYAPVHLCARKHGHIRVAVRLDYSGP
jgi:hypothetical protein